jgi:hypothetical protein
MIEELASQGSGEPFGKGIHVRGARCGADDSRADGFFASTLSVVLGPRGTSRDPLAA